MLWWILLFILSLVVLSKSADYFNESAEAIGLSIGISRMTIGILLLALGTSLPELISSVIAVAEGSPEIVFGNVTGSNIANIFLILGLAAASFKKPIKLEFQFINIDLQFLIASSLFLIITCQDGVFSTGEGVFCLIGYGIYLFYLMSNVSFRKEATATVEKPSSPTRKYYFILPVSILFLFLGGEWTIRSVVELSRYLQVGKEVIASSAIAVGTSLPELFVTLGALRQGKAEMAVGNLLGSCIFNAFAVMGFSSLLGNLIITPAIMSTSLLFLILATAVFFIIIRDTNINRWEGYLFLLFFVLYLVKLFGLF